ncbi:OmpH family outer membrane protein [Tropicibacter sp. S64]|uniref:OmpH family outer membrane protein n=1 Tax=Tropicibacter sp. S64 TaxID=3415122 RepID=UPI003C79AA71
MRRVLACLTLALWPLAGAAQPVGGALSEGVVQSPILVLELERVFSESAYGKSTIADIERESAELAAENRQIETELTEEERRLTEQRATLSPENFRTLADAFDKKVQRLRDEQDAKARKVSARPDEARRQMIQIVQPILRQIMVDSRAAVILERRAVIVAVSDVDVTDLVIERMDAQIGAGDDLPPPAETAPAPAPEPDATPAAPTQP